MLTTISGLVWTKSWIGSSPQTTDGSTDMLLVHNMLMLHHYYKVWKISPFYGHSVGSRACHLIKEHKEFLKCIKKWPVREQANAFVDIHCLLLISWSVYLQFMALFCCKTASRNALIKCYCWAIHLKNTTKEKVKLSVFKHHAMKV
jgi:hypothetical protein